MIPGFLHFVWLGSKPNYAAWSNIRRWDRICTHFKLEDDRIYPILWVDRACFHSIFSDPKTSHSHYILCDETIHDNGVRRHFESMGIKISAYIRGYNQYIPISVIEENIPTLIHRATSGEFAMTPVALNDLFNAIQTESNYDIGGVLVLASDILRVLLLYTFGGIYVDAVGIEPKLDILTKSEIERKILSQGQTSGTAEFIRTGIVSPPLENYALMMDTNDKDVKKILAKNIKSLCPLLSK